MNSEGHLIRDPRLQRPGKSYEAVPDHLEGMANERLAEDDQADLPEGDFLRQLMDDHVDTEKSDQERLDEMVKAIQAAKSVKPGDVTNPTARKRHKQRDG